MPIRIYNPQQWQSILVIQIRSGISVAKFCRQYRLGRQTFYKWRKRFDDLGNIKGLDKIGPIEANKLMADIILDGPKPIKGISKETLTALGNLSLIGVVSIRAVLVDGSEVTITN